MSTVLSVAVQENPDVPGVPEQETLVFPWMVSDVTVEGIV